MWVMMTPPITFFTSVLKGSKAGSWNFMTFSKNLWRTQERLIFGSLGFSMLPWQQVCKGVLRILYVSLWQNFKRSQHRIWFNISSTKYRLPQYQNSAQSVKDSKSYRYMYVNIRLFYLINIRVDKFLLLFYRTHQLNFMIDNWSVKIKLR